MKTLQAIQTADMGDKWYRLFPTGEMRVYDGANPNGRHIASKSPVTFEQFEAMIQRIVDEREALAIARDAVEAANRDLAAYKNERFFRELMGAESVVVVRGVGYVRVA